MAWRRTGAAVAAAFALACGTRPSPGPPTGPSSSAPTPDAGEPDATTADPDGGTDGQAPLCARASEASRLGLVGVARSGALLWGVGRGGETRVLHEFFAGAPASELDLGGWIAEADAVAVMMIEPTACADWRCPPARAEVVVHDASGTRSVAVPVAPDSTPWLAGRLEEGRLIVAVDPLDPSAPDRVTLLDPEDGAVEELPAGVDPWRIGAADEQGWLPARVDRPGDGLPPVLAFVRPGDPTPRLVPGAPTSGHAWRGRWVFATNEGSLGIARHDAVEHVPLDPSIGRMTFVSGRGDHVELWGSGALAALVDLVNRRVWPLPRDAFPEAGTPAAVRTSLGEGWFVASVDGLPVLRVSLAGGAVERLAPAPPGDAAPFDAGFCTPAARAARDGSLLVGLRRAPGGAGLHLWRPEDGDWTRLGRPLHEVLYAVGHARAASWVLLGVTGEGTFCPPLEPWSEPAVDDALAGASTQIVGADGTAHVLPAGAGPVHLDQTGTCALYLDRGASGRRRLHVLDLETHEGRALQDVDGFSGLPASWFGPF